MKTKSCLNCAHKERCLIRSCAIFHLYIQTGRYEEVKFAQESLDIASDCIAWEEKE